MTSSVSHIIIFYNIILQYKQMIKIDSETPLSYQISEISKDSELLSLFNQCQSHQQIMVQQKQQICQLSQIKPDLNFNFRGYYSDQQTSSQKNRQIKKYRQVVNKKEKLRNKKRTKLYLQMLENRVNQLQNQNQKLRKLNKINKQYIHRLTESQHHINGYFVGKQQMLEKLQLLNSEPQPDNTKIRQEIISMRLRQGSFGKDRLKAINYYFKQMVQMLLPEIQKYLIQTSSEKSDFFDYSYLQTGRHRNELQGWRKTLLQSIEMNQSSNNIRNFVKNIQQKIKQQSDKFRGFLESFYNMKCHLIEQARKIQQIFDSVHKYMNPIQISRVLCYIDRYRFEKNISLENTFNQLFQKTTHENFSYNGMKFFQELSI